MRALHPVAALAVLHGAATTADVVAGPVSDQRKDQDLSLDDEVLWPILDRVARGVVTVRPDEHRWAWYLDDGRVCPFSSYLLDRLTKQGYTRWDGYVGEVGHLRVRDDGIRAVKLEAKGHELHRRLSATHVLDRERAACTASPI